MTHLVTTLVPRLPFRCLNESIMAIAGVITTKDVLRNTAIIVREFGPGAYLRCCLAILGRHRTTFLACVLSRRRTAARRSRRSRRPTRTPQPPSSSVRADRDSACSAWIKFRAGAQEGINSAEHWG